MKRVATNFIAIHCAATKPSQDIGRAEIERWHRNQGWTQCGYHYVIRRDGTVEPGRKEDQVGAHVQGHNAVSVGVCLVGGLNEAGEPAAEYTPAQWDALRELVEELRRRYPHARVLGHRDFPGVTKACPSFDVKQWLDSSAGAV